MIKILRDKTIGAVIILLITAAIVHTNLWIQTIGFTPNETGYLQVLLSYLQPKLLPQAWVMFFFILIISQALQLNYLLTSNKMFAKSGFTTAFAYLLLTGVFQEFSTISPALIINSILIWLFAKIIKLYNNKQPKTTLFNIGLMVSICIVLYPPCIVLILFIIFGCIIMRPFSANDFFILLLGFCSVLYIIVAVLYLSNSLNFAKALLPTFSIHFPTPKVITYKFWANIVLLFLFFVIGFFAWLPNSNRMVIQSRKNWGAMLLLFVVLCIYSFIFNNNAVYCLMLLIVPAASFASNFFLYTKKYVLIYFVLIIVASVIAMNNYFLLTKI